MLDNILKFVYSIAVLLFVGNIVSGLFWKLIADKTNDTKIIAHTFKGIFYSDRLITAPTLLIIIILNFIVNSDKYLFFLPVCISVILTAFFVQGLLLFIFIVHPIRQKLYLLAADGHQTGEFDIIQYKKLSKKWIVFGSLELAPFISVLVPSLIF